MIVKYLDLLERLFKGMLFHDATSRILAQVVSLLSLIALSFLLFFLFKWFLIKVVAKIIRKSETKYDDFFLNRKLAVRISMLVPLYMMKGLLYDVTPDFVSLDAFIMMVLRLGIILNYIGILMSILDSLLNLYNSFDISKARPMKGFAQVFKIIIGIVGALLILATLTHQNVQNILLGLGTLSAVFMLVFKDPILGFVGGITLSVNDMVRIGDWIVKGNADGNVTDIGLTTVKVQNWDNTISTIPTYSLIAEPFINWRGMEESGGRRIARAIIIDIDSVKFCTPEMLEKYKKFQIVSRYIEEKEKEIAKFNEQYGVDTSSLVNGRRQTNIGIFRAYLIEYLKQNPNLNHQMTTLVRQRDPNEYGIPLQIYCFTSKTDWLSHEAVQNDIFDHIYAVVQQFDLKLFQRPSSHSINILSEK